MLAITPGQLGTVGPVRGGSGSKVASDDGGDK